MFTHSNRLLAVVIVAILALWGCQKDWMNGNSSTENPQRISESNSEKQARIGRRNSLFPKDRDAAQEIKNFEDLIKGNITPAQYGSKGSDTAIWVLESYANAKYPYKDSMRVVRTDSAVIRVDVVGAKVNPFILINAWNNLNLLINGLNPGDPATMKSMSIIADLRGVILQDGSLEITFLVDRLLPRPIVDNRCKFRPDECLWLVTTVTQPILNCGTRNTGSEAEFKDQVTDRIMNCINSRPRQNRNCNFYTDIETQTFEFFFDGTFIPNKCYCGAELNVYINQLFDTIKAIGPTGKDVIDMVPLITVGPGGLFGNGMVRIVYWVRFGYCRTIANPIE